jgi:hypothetical protein
VRKSIVGSLQAQFSSRLNILIKLIVVYNIRSYINQLLIDSVLTDVFFSFI